MPSNPQKDKGPTWKEFVLYWVFILTSMSLLAWHKGHFIWQAGGIE